MCQLVITHTRTHTHRVVRKVITEQREFGFSQDWVEDTGVNATKECSERTHKHTHRPIQINLGKKKLLVDHVREERRKWRLCSTFQPYNRYTASAKQKSAFQRLLIIVPADCRPHEYVYLSKKMKHIRDNLLFAVNLNEKGNNKDFTTEVEAAKTSVRATEQRPPPALNRPRI